MLTREEQKKIEGMLSLEACISVMFFLILMLLMAGLFRMFMAQNATAHAVLETAESLSLDNYAAQKIGNGSLGSVGEFINGLFDMRNDDNFFSYNNWSMKESDENKSKLSEKLFDGKPDESVESAVKRRFIAYISGGDADEADRFLEKLNVKDGLDGIDFSGSKVENDILYVHIKYKLKYDFHIGNLNEIQVDQKACSRLWK